MRILLFALAIFTIGFTSCKSSKTEPQTQQQVQDTVAVKGVMTFEDALKDIVQAFKNQDTMTLNKYINDEKRLYFLSSTQGSYSACTRYNSMKPLLKASEKTSEYEANPLKYLLDYFNNLNINEIEVVSRDLMETEACAFHEKGFFLDENEADTKLLTDVYEMNLARDGETINSKELLQLGDTQNASKKMVYVSDGEVTYTFYFMEKNNQWWLTIMDMRDCDT